MPMIDVFIAEDVLWASADRALGEQLALTLLKAEGVTNPSPFHLKRRIRRACRKSQGCSRSIEREDTVPFHLNLLRPERNARPDRQLCDPPEDQVLEGAP
jgi:uncharacterized protein with von Willebrand factor type A (vWA) domain